MGARESDHGDPIDIGRGCGNILILTDEEPDARRKKW
jgi:hypothetical protein